MIASRILLMEIGFDKIDGDGIIYLDMLPSMYVYFIILFCKWNVTMPEFCNTI